MTTETDKPQAHPRGLVPEIREVADPTKLTISPPLAVEIGLNESIMLRQLAFLIRVRPHWREGQPWTYQSIDDLRARYFGFWSRATIDRLIKRLADGYPLGDRKVDGLGLITIRSDFNRLKYDRTRWISLNPEAVDALESTTVEWVDQKQKSLSHNETRKPQNETRLNQNETTIPETLTESLKRESRILKDSSLADDESADSSSAPKNGKPPKSITDPLVLALAEVCDQGIESAKVVKVAGEIAADNLGGPAEVRAWARDVWPTERRTDAPRPAPWPRQVRDGLRREPERQAQDRERQAEASDFWDNGPTNGR